MLGMIEFTTNSIELFQSSFLQIQRFHPATTLSDAFDFKLNWRLSSNRARVHTRESAMKVDVAITPLVKHARAQQRLDCDESFTCQGASGVSAPRMAEWADSAAVRRFFATKVRQAERRAAEQTARQERREAKQRAKRDAARAAQVPVVPASVSPAVSPATIPGQQTNLSRCAISRPYLCHLSVIARLRTSARRSRRRRAPANDGRLKTQATTGSQRHFSLVKSLLWAQSHPR
jgi:hypothetical protein